MAAKCSARPMRNALAFAWLDQSESGWSSRKIARREGVSVRAIQLAIAWAHCEIAAMRERYRLIRLPNLVLFFPVNGITPASKCRCSSTNHRNGSWLTCAVCHLCGVEGHPGLQREPRIEPRPDSRLREGKRTNGTRKQKRDRLRNHAVRARGLSEPVPASQAVERGSGPSEKEPACARPWEGQPPAGATTTAGCLQRGTAIHA